MLEATDQDISGLSDEDLRALVARLCEATVRQAGLPASTVTWGGAQDAPDGGVDVRVALPPGAPVEGFVPRPATGIQVKKSDMPPAAIKAEMRPSGTLRPVIGELADQGGAYVIVSSGANLSDAALARRRDAMRAAVTDLPNAHRLHLDFYDRQRLATWVRNHPALAPWVRAKAGRPITGWQSYGAWTLSPHGAGDDYLLNDQVRLHAALDGTQQGWSAAAGLDVIRRLVTEPGKVVRLVGLSGVGKTRFVQALFDERLGAAATDPALAIYTDMGDGPEPPPVAMATSLVARRQRAVLVIDNCAADLHRRLAEFARSADSTLSIVTIEYDVADDLPEGTEVFRLEPASTEVLGRLLGLRFPGMSRVNVDTIAEASGGNARIALTLAHTVGRDESLVGLTDRDLFQRLLHQRHPHDAGLLASAEACSLVYSFDVDTLAGDEAELPRLAALAGTTIAGVFRHVGELKRRDLVQSRGRWRAVLPHAVANRLAADALEKIPVGEIEAQLVRKESERLARSFSRRLGYLHASDAAVRIAEGWMTPPGLLADVSGLDLLGLAMFANVAPLAPEAALFALERAADGPAGTELFLGEARRGSILTRLLRSLAWSPELFGRCASLLIRAALAEKPDENVNSVADLFSSLFSLFLSGTHATAPQRRLVIEELLQSNEARRQELGLRALGAALEAYHFSSVYGFEFGARPRDHGYEPRSHADVADWFDTFVGLCQQAGCRSQPIASHARKLLADQFHALWMNDHARDALEAASRAFSARGRWDEGWLAVRQVLWFYRDDPEFKERERLLSLADQLAPRSLAERIRANVLCDRSPMFDEANDADGEDSVSFERAMQRAQSSIEALGRELAGNQDTFDELRPELVKQRPDATPLWHLGKGLAEGSFDPDGTWHALVNELCLTPEAVACPTILRGFLDGLRFQAPGRVGALLDAAVSHDGLARWFPFLQTGLPLDQAGIARLRRSLEIGFVSISAYGPLRWCGFVDEDTAPKLACVIEAIGRRADGKELAIEILGLLFRPNRRCDESNGTLIAVGRRVLRSLTEAATLTKRGHMLAGLLAACTRGQEGEDIARHLSQLVCRAAGSPDLSHGIRQVMGVLLRTQPDAALTVFLEGAGAERETFGRSFIEKLAEFGPNPLADAPIDTVLAWCRKEPATRFLSAAAAVPYEQAAADGAGLSWTGIAVQVLEQAPDRLGVLRCFAERFPPRSWSGSRAAILSNRGRLLAAFKQDDDERLTAYARTESDRIEREVEQERRWETERSRARDEAFE